MKVKGNRVFESLQLSFFFFLHALRVSVVAFSPPLKHDVLGLELVGGAGEDDGPMHDIAQLADVAGPCVADELVQRLGADADSAPRGEEGEIRGKLGDVLAPRAERRHLDDQSVDAIQEVGPEAPLRGRPIEVAARRRDEAGIGGDSSSSRPASRIPPSPVRAGAWPGLPAPPRLSRRGRGGLRARARRRPASIRRR